MKNLRTYILTKEEADHFDPIAFTKHLKEAGFKFDAEICPVKITKPWDRVELSDGEAMYRQWEE